MTYTAGDCAGFEPASIHEFSSWATRRTIAMRIGAVFPAVIQFQALASMFSATFRLPIPLIDLLNNPRLKTF